MANLKDIKRRIGSVQSTQKITNAMKLVSAAKFARAAHAIQAARPYGKEFDGVVNTLLAMNEGEVSSPLVEQRPIKRRLFVVVGSDRGLCGGFNTNVFKFAEKCLAQYQGSQSLTVQGWGRRALLFCNRSGSEVLPGYEKILATPTYEQASELTDELVKRFLDKEFDEVFIIFPKFKSAVEQEPTLKKLLPVQVEESSASAQGDVLVEPSLAQLLDPLLKRFLVSTVHRILLESAASEHGARMSAMDNATNNAKEVQKKLTLVYNRARQAAITTELTEIISGAEALN